METTGQPHTPISAESFEKKIVLKTFGMTWEWIGAKSCRIGFMAIVVD